MAFWYRVTVAAGETVELRLRLTRDVPGKTPDLGAGFELIHADRSREADEYYATLTSAGSSDNETAVMRQAFAGMVWSQQFYHYDVARWLHGDTVPPPAARKSGRNANWRHLNNHDIISMPDKWEYPWYAAWDLAFHCVVLAHIDPSAAKHQLLLLAREWYMHPNGQLPAYEWNFGDVNPPVHAWAALAVFQIDGGTDFDFLARAFQKLLINFTWWVNRKDACGDNVFEGGFLGLDNIGPFDRSQMLPDGDVLEQSDSTAWMAKFCLNMLEMALRLANHQPTYEDVAVKFFEHFALIAAAMGKLWDEQDGFFYDRLRKRDGSTFTVRARSMVEPPPSLCNRTARCIAVGATADVPQARALVHREQTGRCRIPAHAAYQRALRADLAGGQVAHEADSRVYARRIGVSVALRAAIAFALPPRTSAYRQYGRACRSSRL